MGREMKFGMVVLALLAPVTAVSAADVLAPAPAAPVYRPAPTPAFNWSGFYVGAMGGYGWSDRVTVAGVVSTGADIKGGFAGGTVGFNYQAPGSMFVVGAEADAAWSNINFTDTVLGLATAKEQINAFGSVTGRAGVAIDNLLLYGKGGYAWANNEFSLTVLGLTLANSQFHSGWTVGGGAEWAFSGPWSAKAEYMFARYSQQNYFAALAPPGLSFGMDVHTVKAGINYRFGWGGPVVAKY
jgi:outer membrane immunogenic protein